MKGRTRMRTLLMVLLLLTCGAIINVAVAWGLYLWRPIKSHKVSSLNQHQAARVWDRCWPTALYPSSTADRRTFGFEVETFVVSGPCYGWIATWHGSPDMMSGQDAAWEPQAGWPAVSLIGHSWGIGKPSEGLLNLKGTTIATRLRKVAPIVDNFLPYLPLWPGFAINTVFYAAMLWLLFFAPGFVRRRIRTRRGQCPACGYPIGTNPLCTECGKPVR